MQENENKISLGLEDIKGSPITQRIKELTGRDTAAGRLISRAARGISASLAAYILSLAGIGGVFPFGIAYLSASEKDSVFILSGLLLSALVRGENVLIWSLTYCSLFTIRLLIARVPSEEKALIPKLNEPILMRMAAGATASFIFGIYLILDLDLSRTGLRSALLLMALCPILTYLFAASQDKSKSTPRKKDISALTLIFSLILGLDALPIWGISPAVTAAAALTLCAAYSGAARGATLGMIFGLACGISYSSVIGLAGAAAGAVKKKTSLLPLFVFFLVSSAVSYSQSGIFSLISVIPELMWGCALFIPIAKLGALPKVSAALPLFQRPSGMDREELTKSIIIKKKQSAEEARMAELAGALSSLSSVFYSLSNRIAEPGLHRTRALCENSLKRLCAKCKSSSVCWGKDYETTSDAITKLASGTAKNGSADAKYLPAHFKDRCPGVGDAIEGVNVAYARMLEAAAKENKTEIFALDYEDMARLLSTAAEQSAAEYECDGELSTAARESAEKMGLYCMGLSVFGKRRKSIIAGGVDVSGVTLSSAEICAEFERSLGIKLSVPEFILDGDYLTMTMSSRRRLCCEYAKACLKKDSETVNGDSSAQFINKEDIFYSIISDGMGSGREAALTSKTTCIFLQRMLISGNRKSVVLKMLNNFIRNKNLECFSTVDLLEIDLLSGKASFIKSGAAASYILRDKKLFKISSASLPIGITREINAEEIKFDIRTGDIIVMISDGICQSFEDGVWLLDLLSSGVDPSCDVNELAETVLDAAKASNKRSDDMTVSVIRVGDAL